MSIYEQVLAVWHKAATYFLVRKSQSPALNFETEY